MATNAHPGGLDSLLTMGFEQAAATRALSAANGDVNLATSLLLDSPTQVRVMSGTRSPPGSSAGDASDEQTTTMYSFPMSLSAAGGASSADDDSGSGSAGFDGVGASGGLYRPPMFIVRTSRREPDGAAPANGGALAGSLASRLLPTRAARSARRARAAGAAGANADGGPSIASHAGATAAPPGMPPGMPPGFPMGMSFGVGSAGATSFRLSDPTGGNSGRVPFPLGFILEIAQEFMRSAMESQRPTAHPACEAAMEKLVKGTVDDARPDCLVDACAVCQESFSLGDEYTRMPCEHHFHTECLKPWLTEHNTCPTCRYELETDDKDYNHTVVEAQRTLRAENLVTRLSGDYTSCSIGELKEILRCRKVDYSAAIEKLDLVKLIKTSVPAPKPDHLPSQQTRSRQELRQVRRRRRAEASAAYTRRPRSATTGTDPTAEASAAAASAGDSGSSRRLRMPNPASLAGMLRFELGRRNINSQHRTARTIHEQNAEGGAQDIE
eukprot:SAG11_NODE_211_length_12281_cov_11.326219_5_plen_498_part_00